MIIVIIINNNSNKNSNNNNSNNNSNNNNNIIHFFLGQIPISKPCSLEPTLPRPVPVSRQARFHLEDGDEVSATLVAERFRNLAIPSLILNTPLNYWALLKIDSLHFQTFVWGQLGGKIYGWKMLKAWFLHPNMGVICADFTSNPSYALRGERCNWSLH